MQPTVSGLTHTAMLDASPIATSVVDGEGTVVYVNDAFLAYARVVLGVEIQREERIGGNIREFSTGKGQYDREKWEDVYDRVLKRGEAVVLSEYRTQSSLSEEMYVDVRINPIKEEDGKVIAAVLTWQDVTDRVKRQKEERRRAAVDRVRAEVYGMKQLEEVDRVLTAMNHELREIGVAFNDCGINLFREGTEPAEFDRYWISLDKGWIMTPLADINEEIEKIWHNGEPAYRRDLEAEDPYGEKRYIDAVWEKPIRSVLDVPFSKGTLAINSVEADAFSEEDIETLQQFADVLSAGYTRFEDIGRIEESERGLRTERDFRSRLIDVSPAFLVVIDAQGKTAMMNRSMLEALGYSEGEIQGTDYLSTFVSERDHELVSQVFEGLLRTGETSVNENHILTRDGRELLVEWHGCPILNAEGEVDSFFGVGVDITERKRMEERLRESERELRAILDASPIPTTVVDREGTVIYVNDTFLELASEVQGTEVRREDRVGGNVRDFMTDESVYSQQTWWEIYDRVLKGGESVFLEELSERSSLRREAYTDVRMSPVKGEDGQILAAVVTWQDVTDRVKARKEGERKAALDRIRVAVYEMREATDIEDVLMSIRASLEEAGLEFEDCTVQLVDEEQASFQVYGVSADTVELWKIRGSLRDSAVYDAWRDQRIIYRQDLDKEDTYHAKTRMRARHGKQIRSALDVPFSHGTLALSSVRPDAFSGADIEVLGEFSEVLSEAYTRFEDIRRTEASEERYRRLFEHSNDAVFIHDFDGRILDVNERACEMLGYTRDQLLSMRISSLPPEEVLPEVEGAFRTVQEEGSVRFESRMSRTDDAIIDVDISARVVDDENGIVQAIMRDITERKRAEEELRTALSEIQALKEQVQAENIYLREEIRMAHLHGDIISQSQAMKSVMAQAEQVTETDSTVLVLGETGTGKELLARAIHNMSRRKDHPLVIVNCAAMPSALVESELFGREKGAYTGALTRQIGRFEIADGSTLFLDEIGELSPEVQAKLLRVLQEGQFERLGSTDTITVDVRAIAATNRDLEDEVEEGRFREDLFYRLNVFPITIPPLRERKEDIAPLVWVFVGEFSEKMGKRITSIARRSMEALQRHPWPGNVRELRNLIERTMIQATGSTLNVQLPSRTSRPAAEGRTLADVDRQHIVEVLEQTGWRVRGSGGAAEILGLKPSTLEARMSKLGIHRPR